MSAPPDSLDPSLQPALDALTDDEAIDWNDLESRATDPSVRETLRRLRLIARIAHAHEFASTLSDSPPDGARLATPCEWGLLHVIEPVARGAYGEVYRAWDPRLEREVALKLVDEQTSAGASVTVREGRLLARLRHPNIVAVYGADVVDNRAGVWMEFVRGATLDTIVRAGGPLDLSAAAAAGIAVCRALTAVHRAGLVHRDIKAQNVMRDDDGRFVLTDFGTGQETEDAARGGVAGTPAYLAPEVLAGAAATTQSDLYSVGVLLFHLLTGAYPVEAATLDELRAAHARGQKRRLRASRPDLPAPFADVLDRAMAPDARDRFPDAEALESAIAATVEGAGWRTGHRRTIAAFAVASTITLGIMAWNGIAAWRSASDAARPATAVNEVGRVTTRSAEARRAYELSYDLGSKGQWRPALDAARLAISTDPQFASAQVWLAWCLRRTGAPQDDVVAAADHAAELSANATLWEQYWIRGTSSFLHGAFVDALQQYIGLLTIFPDHFWGLENALAAARQWAPSEIARLNQFAARRADLHPMDFLAAERAAEAFLEAGSYNRADEYFARAGTLVQPARPVPDAIVMFPVRRAYLHGDVRLAAAKLKEASALVRTTTGSVRVGLANWVVAYDLTLGHCDDARRTAASIESRIERPLRLASIAFWCGDQRTLHEQLVQAEKSDPRVAALLLEGGFLLDVQRLIETAEGSRRRFLMPAQVQELGVLKGHLAFARGNVAEAMELLKAAHPALESPFFQERYSVLTHALLRQQDVTGALAALRESLIYTAPFEWLTKLGWIDNAVTLTDLYHRLGRVDEAAALEAKVSCLLADADPDFRPLRRLRDRSNAVRSRSKANHHLTQLKPAAAVVCTMQN